MLRQPRQDRLLLDGAAGGDLQPALEHVGQPLEVAGLGRQPLQRLQRLHRRRGRARSRVPAAFPRRRRQRQPLAQDLGRRDQRRRPLRPRGARARIVRRRRSAPAPQRADRRAGRRARRAAARPIPTSGPGPALSMQIRSAATAPSSSPARSQAGRQLVRQTRRARGPAAASSPARLAPRPRFVALRRPLHARRLRPRRSVDAGPRRSSTVDPPPRRRSTCSRRAAASPAATRISSSAGSRTSISTRTPRRRRSPGAGPARERGRRRAAPIAATGSGGRPWTRHVFDGDAQRADLARPSARSRALKSASRPAATTVAGERDALLDASASAEAHAARAAAVALPADRCSARCRRRSRSRRRSRPRRRRRPLAAGVRGAGPSTSGHSTPGARRRPRPDRAVRPSAARGRPPRARAIAAFRVGHRAASPRTGGGWRRRARS